MLCRIICLLLVFTSVLVSGQEPQNLSSVKNQLISYYQNGEYFRGINEVTVNAKNYLAKRVTLNAEDAKHSKKLAIVLDIDETSLSNYGNLRTMDFSFIPKQISEMIERADGKPINSIKELYNYALNHKVAVFFVTGRFKSLADATIKNLHNAGTIIGLAYI